MDTLSARQEAREVAAIEGGIARYRKAMERDPAGVPASQRLLTAQMAAAETAIHEWVSASKGGRARRGASAYKLAEKFEPRVLAYLTLKVILEQTKEGPTKLTRVAMRLSDLAVTQRRLDNLRELAPYLYRRVRRQLQRNRDNYVVLTARRAEKWADIEIIRWTLTDRYKFGRTLIELVANATGFAQVYNWITGKKHQETRVCLTPAAEKALRDAHAAAEILAPIDGPMVCPPRPWVSLMRGDGGFLTGGMSRMGMTAPRVIVKEVNNNVSATVLDAMNAVQATPWRINTAVLDVAEALWETDTEAAGAPKRSPRPLPPASHLERGSDEWKGVMRVRAGVHDANNRTISKAVAWQMALSTARGVADEAAIYFVHTMDFRGRMYPNSSYLSPQGNDLQRGLLQFANGEPLGDNGAYWLAIHGANSYGIDKVSFEDRIAWVRERDGDHRRVARDPAGNVHLWAASDAPWQYLAFCFEWQALSDWVEEGNKQEDFVSHLPVSFDGSCNGLQHFAAMLRDEKAGKVVNLLPTETPNDVYRAVADEAAELLKLDRHTDAGNDLAEVWEPVLRSPTGRSVCKRNTMTQPYAVSDYGMADQLVHDLPGIIEGTEWDEKIDLSDEKVLLKHSRYLAAINRVAIDTQVKSAKRVMGFVREIARVLAAEGQPMRWVTPVGLPVIQNYRVQKAKQSKQIVILGRTVSPVLTVSTNILSVREQDTGAAPNFVHSMDASHLMATVDLCVRSGVTSFAMVHDSYGTHAGSADKMREALTEAFIWQYENHDVLEDLRAGAALALPEGTKLPAVPERGTLDLAALRRAEYFFA